MLLFRQVCALPGFTSTSSHFTTCFTSTRGSLPASFAGVLLFRQVCALLGFTRTSIHFTTCFTSTRGSLPLFRQVCALLGFTSTSSHFTTCFTSTRGSLPASFAGVLLFRQGFALLALLVQEYEY